MMRYANTEFDGDSKYGELLTKEGSIISYYEHVIFFYSHYGERKRHRYQRSDFRRS